MKIVNIIELTAQRDHLVKTGNSMIQINHQLFPLNVLRNSLWFLGILLGSWGTIEQGVTIFWDNHVSYWEFSQLCIAALILISWIALKSALEEDWQTIINLETEDLSNSFKNPVHLLATQTRMFELESQHIIRQSHILPFPYLSQIYHLLNLKHLETVHRNSLGGLKVTEICDIQPSLLGGSVKFRTTLDSPINLLKIWRQSTVEVELTLHNSHTIELNIPVYGQKKMIVLFSVFPLTKTTHEFLVDIYTDLPCPKFLLGLILHLATLITLYEDLPYLKKLSEKGIDRLINSAKISSHETICLFQRFVNLHVSAMHLSYAS